MDLYETTLFFFLSFSESKSLYLILLLQINELAEKYAGLMTLKEYQYVSCKLDEFCMVSKQSSISTILERLDW